jgi:hypothetical protein
MCAYGCGVPARSGLTQRRVRVCRLLVLGVRRFGTDWERVRALYVVGRETVTLAVRHKNLIAARAGPNPLKARTITAYSPYSSSLSLSVSVNTRVCASLSFCISVCLCLNVSPSLCM